MGDMINFKICAFCGSLTWVEVRTVQFTLTTSLEGEEETVTKDYEETDQEYCANCESESLYILSTDEETFRKIKDIKYNKERLFTILELIEEKKIRYNREFLEAVVEENIGYNQDAILKVEMIARKFKDNELISFLKIYEG